MERGVRPSPTRVAEGSVNPNWKGTPVVEFSKEEVMDSALRFLGGVMGETFVLEDLQQSTALSDAQVVVRDGLVGHLADRGYLAHEIAGTFGLTVQDVREILKEEDWIGQAIARQEKLKNSLRREFQLKVTKKDDVSEISRANAVFAVVASRYPFSCEELTGGKRFKELAEARQVSIHLLRKTIDITFRQIGEFLGGRDHSTLIHSIDKVNRRMLDDEDFVSKINDMEQEVEDLIAEAR